MFSFLLTIELDEAAPKASRDQRRYPLTEGRRGNCKSPATGNSLSQPGLSKLFISFLPEAERVKQSSEATASEALPSYEGTSWGMSGDTKGNISY